MLHLVSCRRTRPVPTYCHPLHADGKQSVLNFVRVFFSLGVVPPASNCAYLLALAQYIVSSQIACRRHRTYEAHPDTTLHVVRVTLLQSPCFAYKPNRI